MKAGIDYGNRMTNINHETGIRFGVIHHAEVGQAWYEESEANYGDIECSSCGDDVSMADDDCPNCGADLNSEYDYAEPISFYIDNEYKAEQNQDDCDIFVLDAPYFTYCRFCSPCAPGAGYLMNHTPEGIKAYCFGHDWYEGGKAPYPVYSVETGKLV